MAEPYIDYNPDDDWRPLGDDSIRLGHELDPDPEPLLMCRCVKLPLLGHVHAEPWAIAASNKAMICHLLEVPWEWIDDYVRITLDRLKRSR